MRPIVYLNAKEVSALFQRPGNEHVVVDGFAYAFDDWTVFHASVAQSNGYSGGAVIPVRFIPLSDAASFAESESRITSSAGLLQDRRTMLCILLAIDRNTLKHKCFFIRSQEAPL